MIPKYVHCLGFLGCFKDMFSFKHQQKRPPLSLGKRLKRLTFWRKLMFCWKPQHHWSEGKFTPQGVTNVHHHTTYIAFLSLVKVIRWDMPSEIGA